MAGISARRIWRDQLWLLPLILGLVWSAWLGYTGLNGQDSHDYLRVCKAWSAWLSGGPRPAAAEHPPAFPLAGALLAQVIGSEHLALRCLPLLGFVLIALAVLRIARVLDPTPPVSAMFVLLCIGASPFLLRGSLVIMSDIPAAALMVLAYAAMVRWRWKGGRWWILLAILLALVATLVRYAAIPMIGGAVLLSVLFGRGQKFTWSLVGLAFVGLAVLTFVLPEAGLHGRFHGTPLEDWSALNFFRREHHSDDGVLHYRAPNLLYVCSIFVNPGFIPIGILLLPFIRWADLRTWHAGLAGSMVAVYLLFIAGLPFQNDRVMLFAQPFTVILFFPAFGRAWQWMQERTARLGLIVVALLVVQLALSARAMLPFIRHAELERILARQVNMMQPHQVYTHGMGAALFNYCPGVEVRELWYGAIDRFEPGALIVVDPQNLAEQWQGLYPGENWERARQQGVDSVAGVPEGWGIYRVR